MKWEERLTALLLALLTVVPALSWAPPASAAPAEDTYSGSDLWLHYVPVSDPTCWRATGPRPRRSSWRTPTATRSIATRRT